MKKLVLVVTVILVCGKFANSQTTVTGKWLGQSTLGDLALDLKEEGTSLIGTVSLGGRAPDTVEDGKISGNAIEFTIRGTMLFTGTVTGDEITFSMRRPPAPTGQTVIVNRVSAFRGGPFQRQIAVYDRTGNIVRRFGEPSYSNELAVLSPDGKRLAVVQSVVDAGPDIWVYDVATGSRSRVRTGPAPNTPVWAPDGAYVAYYAYRQGRGGLYRKRSDGSGSEELLFRLPAGVSDGHLTDWSADGRFLVFDTSAVVWVVPLDRKQRAVDLLREGSEVFGARFSPDSRFLAYVSAESGRNEVYVRPFDPASVRFAAPDEWRVSSGGGEGMVHWRGDGREIYYIAPDSRVMAVEVSGPRFKAGSPRVLFRSPITVRDDGNTDDDRNGRMSRDGSRFVFAEPPNRTSITVPPPTLAEYAGRYVNPVGTTVEVTVQRDGLLIPISGTEERMIPTAANVFFRRNPEADVDVEFERDATGAITYLTVYRGDLGTKWRRTDVSQQTLRRGGAFPWRLSVFDLEGRVVRTVGDLDDYHVVAVSPKGDKVAVALRRGIPELGGQGTTFWTIDLSTGSKTRLTSYALRWPLLAWSPDGRQVAFLAQRDGHHGLYRGAADGTGREQLLYKFPVGVADVYVCDWSPDGRYLAFSTAGVLHVLPVTGERTPIELIREEFQAHGARFSPDNRFLAYTSDETGRKEVYVRGFDAASGQFTPGEARKVSADGGDGVIDWRPDGRGLYYLAGDGAVMAVDVSFTPQFSAQSPRLLFRIPTESTQLVFGDRGHSGSVTPDGLLLFRTLAPPERKVVMPAPDVLAEYAGTYVNQNNPKGVPTVVWVANGQLVQQRGAQKFVLNAESDAYFYRRAEQADVDIEFSRDASGVVYFTEYTTANGVRWIRK